MPKTKKAEKEIKNLLAKTPVEEWGKVLKVNHLSPKKQVRQRKEEIIVDRGQFKDKIMLCGYCFLTRGVEIRCKGGEHEMSHYLRKVEDTYFHTTNNKLQKVANPNPHYFQALTILFILLACVVYSMK